MAFDDDDGGAAEKSTPSKSTRSIWGDDLVVVHGGLGEGRFALGDTWILMSSSASSASSSSSNGDEGGGWVCLPAAASSEENPLPPPPPPRAFHCGAALGASLFIFGGHAIELEEGEEQGPRRGNMRQQRHQRRLKKRNDLFRLDLSTMAWEDPLALSSPSLPCPRDFASMCSLPRSGTQGLLLLHGGLDSQERRLGDTWIFDVALNRWKKIETGFVPSSPSPSSSPVLLSSPSSSSLYPLPRYGASLTRVGDRAFLVGGDTGARAEGGKVELFSFVAGAAALAAAASSSSGGNNNTGNGHHEGDEDEDAPPAWILLDLPDAPEARKGHAAAALGNWLVVAGGRRVEATAAAAAAAAASGGSGGGGGGGRWRGGGLLLRRGSAGAEAGGSVSPSKGSVAEKNDNSGDGLFGDAFVLDCGGGRVRWRRASGGLGLGGEEDEDEDEEEEEEGAFGSRPPRREFASLISLPAVDGGCLLLLGGGDGRGALLADAQRATPAAPAAAPSSPPSSSEPSCPFAGRAPPPPPPLAPLALRGFGSSRGKWRRSGEGGGGLSRGSGGGGGGGSGSGPGTPLSAASESDDGGAFPHYLSLPLSLPPPPPAPFVADPAVEAKMQALRARLGCSSSNSGENGRHALSPPPPPPSAPSSASTSSRLGDRARSSAELAGVCAKETSELTMGDLKALLAAVKRAGEAEAWRRRQQWNGDCDAKNETELFCSVEPPEALRIGRAAVLQQAAAASLRLL